MRDMVKKRRNKRMTGELHYAHKLTPKNVSEIRNGLANKAATIKDYAAKFGVNFMTIYHVARGKSWDTLPGPRLRVRPVRNLSVQDVVEIRALCQQGMTQTEVADKFGIWQATVSQIRRGIKRKDVPLCPI